MFCSFYLVSGAVTNAHVVPRPLYLDNAPVKSSLPPLQPFKRHVHVPEQSHDRNVTGHSGSVNGESPSDGVPMVLKGRLHSEVRWSDFAFFVSTALAHFHPLTDNCAYMYEGTTPQ